jgi:pyridinium-3,5-bisthiocarboxylic acid mononucleotide nickel chelatase
VLYLHNEKHCSNNFMSTRIAIIDSQTSGISGDMLLSSLVDVGANKQKVLDAVLICQNFLKGSKIKRADFVKTTSNGFSATQFQFEYTDSVSRRRGIEMYRSLGLCCDSLDMQQRAKTFVLESLKTIIKSESIVHSQEVSTIHLHETSSIDTFADLIGSAVALQDLGLFDSRIFSTRVSVGGGYLKFSHGTISNPSNAILEIFKDRQFTLLGGRVQEELTTPTGAAMLVNLTSESINYYPSFSPEKIGYGAGHKKLKYVPNILRLVIGKSSLISQASTEIVHLLETNIDDVSGEVIGNLIDVLMEAGALDVVAIPGISKKNRPVYVIRVITDQSNMNNIMDSLFRESGSLGIRIQELQRFVLPRTVLSVQVDIDDKHFNVHVKIAKDTMGNTISIKPEFEDIKIIASQLGLPFKRTMDLVTAKALQRLEGI